MEAEVWNAAREVILSERPRNLNFNLGEDAAYDNGLICGGQIPSSSRLSRRPAPSSSAAATSLIAYESRFLAGFSVVSTT